jgi:hypothetical protein
MDSILVVWLLPELLPLAFLLVLVVIWLMQGNFDRILPRARPRNNRVSSAYWGDYEGASELPDGELVLPEISPVREPVRGKDWTGGEGALHFTYRT